VNLSAIKVLGKSVAVVAYCGGWISDVRCEDASRKVRCRAEHCRQRIWSRLPRGCAVYVHSVRLGQMAGGQYVLWKREQEAKENAEAEKLLEEAALCHGSNSH
jgi:hypothetical protein